MRLRPGLMAVSTDALASGETRDPPAERLEEPGCDAGHALGNEPASRTGRRRPGRIDDGDGGKVFDFVRRHKRDSRSHDGMHEVMISAIWLHGQREPETGSQLQRPGFSLNTTSKERLPLSTARANPHAGLSRRLEVSA